MLTQMCHGLLNREVNEVDLRAMEGILLVTPTAEAVFSICQMVKHPWLQGHMTSEEMVKFLDVVAEGMITVLTLIRATINSDQGGDIDTGDVLAAIDEMFKGPSKDS
jgi:hypothetical protein